MRPKKRLSLKMSNIPNIGINTYRVHTTHDKEINKAIRIFRII